ncbi:hypothetical protein GGR56DRAFT_14510 [Xylariaceae sp. FL0804]|nr:hypothetical protein GGR56DRAFT_14510 [Xylariaceae sp. FL0804]
MAAPNTSMAGIQRRAAEDPAARYRAFDSYPWQKDRAFLAQLSTALEPITSDGANLSAAALQTRILRFEQQTKIKVDAGAYKQWLVENNSSQPRIISEQTIASEAMSVPNPADRKLSRLLIELGDPLGRAGLEAPAPPPPPAAAAPPAAAPGPPPVPVPVPSWQSAAPTAELYVDKAAAAEEAAAARGASSSSSDANTDADPDKEPYPKKFEEIVEFLQTGREIPGIRKIPDTVVDDPSISTTGRMAAPPKPWEQRRAVAGAAATAGEAGDGGPAAAVGSSSMGA